jgi:hypothetical protein
LIADKLEYIKGLILKYAEYTPNPAKPEMNIEDLWFSSRSAGACAACRSVYFI